MCDLVFGVKPAGEKFLVCLLDQSVETYSFNIGDTVREILYKFKVVIEKEVVSPDFVLEEPELLKDFTVLTINFFTLTRTKLCV